MTILLPKKQGPQTIQSLKGEKLQVLSHPSYSPDLAPCDFWLFSALKTGLAGRILHIQDLARAVNSQPHVIPLLEYHGAFQK